MKIYISCHHPDPANELAAELKAAGHTVVSDWHSSGEVRPGLEDGKSWARKSGHNFNLISTADVVVLIASADHVRGVHRVSGGKFVEAGFAMGSGCPVVAVGGVENGMLHAANHVGSTDELIRDIATIRSKS